MVEEMNARRLDGPKQRVSNKRIKQSRGVRELIPEENEDFTHDEVFGDLKDQAFSCEEAAEFLAMSVPKIKELVTNGGLSPDSTSKSQMQFLGKDLIDCKNKILAGC